VGRPLRKSGDTLGPTDSRTHTFLAPAESPVAMGASLPAGTVIAGRFTVEGLAGRGGMGTVYRASDSLSGQRVALKLLHVKGGDAPRRFTREAELLSALRHPGIVSYLAYGQSEQGQPFLAMQWLEGEELAQRLARQPLSPRETLSLLRHSALALSTTATASPPISSCARAAARTWCCWTSAWRDTGMPGGPGRLLRFNTR